MTKMKLTLLSLMILFSTAVFSQTDLDTLSNYEAETIRKSARIPLAIGVSASTNGVGGWIHTSFFNLIGVRLGYENLNFGINEFDVPLNGQDLKIKPDFKSGGVSLMADIYALKWLYVSGGFEYSHMNISAVAKSATPIVVGDIPLSPNDIGELAIGIKPEHRFSPCLTLGFGRNIAAKKRLAFSLEMGAYFMGSYQVDVSGTKLFEANGDPANIKPLNDALRDLSWSGVYPIVKLGISYRLF